MLISKETSEALDILLGAYFDLNRSFDRAVSIMQNAWAMPNASDIIHHRLAHLFPLLGDYVSEIKDKCNLTSIYPETHRDAREYINLEDMMSTLLNEVTDVYKIINDVNEIAKKNGDFIVHSELVILMNLYSDVIAQVTTLYEKSQQLPTDYVTYDRHIGSWKIDGIPELMNNRGDN